MASVLLVCKHRWSPRRGPRPSCTRWALAHRARRRRRRLAAGRTWCMQPSPKGSRFKAPALPSQLALSQSQRLGHSSFQAAGRLVVASTSPPPGTAKPVTTRRLSSARCGDGNRIAPGGSDPPDVRCVLPCPTAYRSPLITLILMLSLVRSLARSVSLADGAGRDVTPKDDGRPASARRVRYGHCRVPGRVTRPSLEFLARLPKLNLVACGVVLLPLYSLLN